MQLLMILLYGIVPFVLSFLGGYLAVQARHKEPEIDDLAGALERMTEADLQDVRDRVGEQHQVTPESRRQDREGSYRCGGDERGYGNAYSGDPRGVPGGTGLGECQSRNWTAGQPDSGSLDRYIGHGTRDNSHLTVKEGESLDERVLYQEFPFLNCQM